MSTESLQQTFDAIVKLAQDGRWDELYDSLLGADPECRWYFNRDRVTKTVFVQRMAGGKVVMTTNTFEGRPVMLVRLRSTELKVFLLSYKIAVELYLL